MNDDSLSEPLTRHIPQADAVPLRNFYRFHLFAGIFTKYERSGSQFKWVQLAN